MIPKTIHYCWFGGNPLPESARAYIESWKRHCPDYEIIEWNESNFDLNWCDYVREAYEAKKWAFVTDVVRLVVLVEHGGIYMDTDVEVLKPLDDILQYEAVSGFEAQRRIPTGLMAAQPGSAMFAELLRDYEGAHFRNEDGSYNLTTNVARITQACLKYGLELNNTLQTVNGFTLFPKDYFCAKDYETGKVYVTENTYTIHHFAGSWLSEEARYALQKKGRYAAYMPKKLAGALAVFVSARRYRGLGTALKEVAKRVKQQV